MRVLSNENVVEVPQIPPQIPQEDKTAAITTSAIAGDVVDHLRHQALMDHVAKTFTEVAIPKNASPSDCINLSYSMVHLSQVMTNVESNRREQVEWEEHRARKASKDALKNAKRILRGDQSEGSQNQAECDKPAEVSEEPKKQNKRKNKSTEKETKKAPKDKDILCEVILDENQSPCLFIPASSELEATQKLKKIVKRLKKSRFLIQ